MKSEFLILSTLLLCGMTMGARGADNTAAASDSRATLRVMSFNVRNSHAWDGFNGWLFRKKMFFQTIEKFNPDLVGFQEVLANQYDAIESTMKDYALSGVARNDGKRQGEWALIVYRKSRFELLDSGNFWLSKTPTVPGSKSWDAGLTRICSWVLLRDRQTRKEFLYANTHYDNSGAIARENSSRIIMKKLPKLAKGNPIILTGDFNTTEDDPPYKTIMHPTEPDMAHFIDSYREVHPVRSPNEASYNAFQGRLKGSRIDFILHTPEFKAISATIDRTKSPEGRTPSDHYPVTAVLQWAKS
ncbi:MAG TPA: endonuclease/exonuclease/phosphatase family protein [Tepidisphaeraceae bacterium]|nr:endonuclease/exonuclease/phosphatase family protein [Tepidisphaeraceae bacterium]